MIVRIFGNKLKFCRLYEDDVFGNLNIRPKANQKFLNLLYKELKKQDFKYKVIIKDVRSFVFIVKTYLYKFLKQIMYKIKYFKIFYKHQYFVLTKKKKNISLKILQRNFIHKSLFNFFSNKFNLNININLLYYLFKKIRLKKKLYWAKLHSQSFSLTQDSDDINIRNKKKNYNLKFNYNFEGGKPKRKKKRVTLYFTRLLTRHRIRFFASRMTVRQIRSYVKKHRGSKFFGMFFIWMLETRVDVILYRLNLQASAFNCRQYIRHFGVYVNNIFINLPSFRLKFFDYLTLINKKEMFEFLLFKFLKKLIFMSLPFFYEINYRIMTMSFFFKPPVDMIFFPFPLEVQRLAGIGDRF
jgi:ribosomal protein S4